MNQPVIKESSPFTPGKPVPKEFFEGRLEEFNYAVQIIKKTAAGNSENLYITGERGIGKSSFARLIKNHAQEKENFITGYVSLGGVSDLDEMADRIFSCVVQDNQGQSFFGKLSQLFKKHVKEVGIGNLSIQLNFTEQDRKEMVKNFLPLLWKIFTEVGDKRGILIVLDEINGIAKNKVFADYLKSLVDTNEISQKPLPLSLVLCSLPERKEEIVSAQESVARMFYPITLKPMTADETISFYRRVFQSVNNQWNEDALQTMSIFAGGFPALMQEIGEATFYADQDFLIDKADAHKGVTRAAEIVGEKYLAPKVYATMCSEKYKKILDKLAENPIPSFSKQKTLSLLDAEEKKVFGNFLQRMSSLGVIARGEKSGEYRFTNMLYPLYVYMRSQSHHKPVSPPQK
jgi:nucleoside-triphosphatase THEP1